MRECLWRSPERLSYEVAVESSMCPGTESVLSTGLWKISVHLDNRVLPSLGWHSISGVQQPSHFSTLRRDLQYGYVWSRHG